MKLLKQLLMINLLIFSFILEAEEQLIATVQGQGGTGFTVNNVRNFTVDQNTIIKEDGVIIPGIDGQGGTGFKVRYRVTDVSPDVTSGILEELDFINTHIGPVTSLDPFKIFNVDALITGNTFFENELTFDAIEMGDELKLSGFVDSNSSLLVGRVEAEIDPVDWKLSGYVANLSSTQFNIQNQVVIIGKVIAENCAAGFVDGVFVEIKATPDPLFMAGSPLTTVTDIECNPEGIITLPGDVIPVALEGMVDFEDINGELDDIVVGAKVEVEGLLNTTTSIIDASSVKFSEVRFKFEEPVLPTDVIVGESIQLFGRTILTTPQLRDEDGIMGSGLGEELQVEVRGYADREGNLYATRVRERGNPDASDVSAEGQVNAINDPFFEVNGVTVDTTNSLFLGIDGLPINSVEFFASITIGTELGVEGADLNEVTHVISGGIIQIDEPDAVNGQGKTSKAGAGEGLGIGTITSLGDVIFASSFE